MVSSVLQGVNTSTIATSRLSLDVTELQVQPALPSQHCGEIPQGDSSTVGNVGQDRPGGDLAGAEQITQVENTLLSLSCSLTSDSPTEGACWPR